ncbi:uncharacterized protein [Linepithema humile]|uniref:uncharacterized protein isoform X3 n=1 Tax=Linepithema humile TaxID=83485 RepID=UPI00351E9513
MVALANAIMTSSMVVCDVITARYQRYSFRGSVLVALAFTSSVNAVNCVKLSNHYLKSIERQRYINIYYICTMDNSIEITLKDAETEKEFKLRLSPTSAFKAETETEHMQTTISYDTPLEEASGYQILEQSQRETKEEMREDPLFENKEKCLVWMEVKRSP